MGILTRLTRGCLRLGVRRWPVELRDELAQEWLAELAALEREPGNAWQRLTFAASLAASPVTCDEHGLPGSRVEWWRAPGPVLRASLGLLLAGGFGLGVWLGAQMLLNSLLIDPQAVHGESWYPRIAFIVAALAAVLTSAYTAVVGWWLGGHAAAGARGAGIGRRAGLAVGILVAVLVVGWQGGSEDAFTGVRRDGFATTVLAWALVTFAVVVVACRRVAAGQTRRSWGVAVAGALLASVVAPVAAMPVGAPVAGESRWQIALIACRLLPLTVCAVSFGWAAARPRPAGVTGTGPTALPSAGAVASVAGEVSADGEVRARRLTTTRAAVTVAAAGAAVLWAIGLVLLQPLSEPAAGSVGGNNTYWARELRWGAIVAVVLAVVVCARAQRRATAGALLGGLVWLAADVAFDRAELSHGGISLAVAAAGVAVAGCYRGMTRRGAPHRTGLLVAAAVATVLSGVSLLTESPTDTETGLNLGSAGASCALALIAVGAAFTAAPDLSRIRYSISCLGGAVAAAMPWLLRDWYPKPTSARTPLGLGFTALLAICVVVVAWRRPEKPSQWLGYPAVVAGTLLVFPLVFTPAVIALMFIDVGGVFTALAGNPPINSADEDVILAMPAVLAGVVLGGLLVIGEPGRKRPAELPSDDGSQGRSQMLTHAEIWGSMGISVPE